MTDRILSHARPSRADARPRPPSRRLSLSLDGLWHNLEFRSILYQALVIVAVIAVAAYMIGNAQDAMHKRGISTGFGFLTEEAGFAIGEALIAYDSSDTYLKAYGVAILNTLQVSAFGIVAATFLGLLIGVARLSRNWIVAHVSSLYVEVFRNTPQLVQIIFWYTLVIRLPHPKQAWNISDAVFLSNRGVVMAWPAPDPVHGWMAVAFVAACAAAFGLMRWADWRRRRTGRTIRVLWWNIALLILLPSAVWLAGGTPADMNVPRLRGFNFVGGVALSPEFLALLLGLSLYIAAFIAEIVRSGVQAVSRGQIEAARAIGLGRIDLYRRVILPQALRVIIPPAAAQYVSLTKNSSLGVVIGYPELFNVNNTITTLSGNTIECVGIMMAVYLTIAFSIAAFMNFYNKIMEIKER